MTGLSHVGVWVNPAFKLYGFENGKDYLLPVSYGILVSYSLALHVNSKGSFFPLTEEMCGCVIQWGNMALK